MLGSLSTSPVPNPLLVPWWVSQEARQDQEAWAKNNLEEQSLCLEVLFLYFYCREPVFEPETILSYARYLKV